MNFKDLVIASSLCLLLSSCEEEMATQVQCQNGFSSSVVGNPLNPTTIIGPIDWIKYNQTGDEAQNANEQAVAQVKIPAIIASCTGFLINEDTLMTNNHCIGSASNAVNVTAIFRDEEGKRTTFVCDQFLTTNFQYDFSLVKCKNSPGKTFGWVGLSNERPEVYSRIYVVQENCDYLTNPHCTIDKYVAFGEVLGSQTTRVYHDADTLAGSSGSPIFSDDTQQVIALHNAGSVTSDPSSAKNGGVPMYKIRNIIETTTNVRVYDVGTTGEYQIPSTEPNQGTKDQTPETNNNCKS